MQTITSFLQHYIATYQAYLASPIIYQVLFVYVAVMTVTIYVMGKKNDFTHFLTVLFSAITASSVVYTYTFWSLW